MITLEIMTNKCCKEAFISNKLKNLVIIIFKRNYFKVKIRLFIKNILK